jgi:hypothetical protein
MRLARLLPRLCGVGLAALAPVGIARAAEPGGPPPKPWMISEAGLPEGFPPPGPVDQVIVKDYPAYRLARVESAAGANGMFGMLFNHIKRNKIEMTAPVEMAWPDAAEGGSASRPAAMAFLYGEPDWGRTGADPADARVVVEDIPAMQVVSVAMRGAYDGAHFEQGHAQLKAWLVEHPEWEPAGVPRTFNYNSPFVPNLVKVAEVQIPIRPRPKPE